jgi:hypothetical protein
MIKGVSQDVIQLRLFLFSLLGRVKQWFYANKSLVDTWNNCTNSFLAKVLPDGQDECSSWDNFKLLVLSNETIPEAWERLQNYNFDQEDSVYPRIEQ